MFSIVVVIAGCPYQAEALLQKRDDVHIIDSLVMPDIFQPETQ
jgi:hypothetical protein